MLKDFAVKGAIRDILRRPMGVVLSETQFAKKNFEKLACIGDRVSETALKHGFEPKLIIYDRRERRKPVSKETEKKLGSYGTLSFKCKNPAGVLSLDAWQTVANALSSNSPARIEVDGEEDLLALAVLFLAPVGWTLAYGQPGKGIVALEVTDEMKQYYILHICAELGKTFLNNLKGKTVIVHDSDTDGCSSAAIFVKYLKNRGLEAVPMVTRDSVIHPNIQRQISNLKPENLIIMDLGGEAHEYIRGKSRHMKVLVVDHHHLHANVDFGRAEIVNPHLFHVPERLNPPTAYLAYIICEALDWVSALGVVADKGEPSCPAFVKEMSEKYQADFEQVKEFTNAADVLKDSEYIVTALLKSKKPQDLMKDKKLVAYEKQYRGEVERLLKLQKKDARVFRNEKVVVFDIKSEYSLRGAIANRLQELYPGWTVIIGDEQGGFYAMSMRTGAEDVNLVTAIHSTIPKFRQAVGGGHAKASGCKVLTADKEEFLAEFIKNL